MIAIENITKSFTQGGVTTEVLKGISFRVTKGEFVAIMGSSGAGKSTLMNILGGLAKPTAGTYQLDGVNLATATDNELSRLRNQKIGFVFQQFHLLERADALQNVRLPLIYGASVTDGPARASRALDAVGLSDRKHHRPGQLSGGQQQRVAIARALVTDPAILLADEPTGNLDRQNSLEILAIFQRLHREGRTIVMITHDPEIAAHAQRILTLNDGRITEDRPVETLRNAAKELGALPSVSS